MGIIQNKKVLNKALRGTKTVFIMAHKDLDLDALGSSIGTYLMLQKKRKDCYIIIDDMTHELGVEKVLRELEGCFKIIKSDKVEKYKNKKDSKNLLIILDTSKKELVQNEKILTEFDRKLIVDHHDLSKKSIKDAIIINDTEVSSTCEIITQLIELYDVEIESYYATVLLAGIVLDTNNFTLKTTPETYYSAYYLANLGASAKKVQYLLKQDIADYTQRQKLLSGIETINGRIAITKASQHAVYRREELAKVADTLLFFNNIEASFVIGKIGKNVVGLSARSLGNYEINKILEKLGGGGSDYNGAARFENTTISKVEQLLKKTIKEMGE